MAAISDGTLLGNNSGAADAPSAIGQASWTPALQFGGAAVGMTYSGQAGTYIKLGKTIIASFNIGLSALGSSTGNATIAGLPFTSSGAYSGALVVGYDSDQSGLTAPIMGYVGLSSTSLNLGAQGSTAFSSLTNSNFTNGDVLYGTIIYVTP